MKTKRYLQMVYVQSLVQSCIPALYTEAVRKHQPHASETHTDEHQLAHQQTLIQRRSQPRSPALLLCQPFYRLAELPIIGPYYHRLKPQG